MLSRDNIKQALVDGHLKIFPFEKKNLTGIGYNLSTTDFAFSVNQGILLTLHQEVTDKGVMRYVIIPPNDTVLFFSREYIEIDDTLSGTFHSKVSCVSQGLGHISTTLDPTWKGQLLLSLNNPTSQEVVFDLDKDGGNIVTLLLYKLDTTVTGENIHDNNKGRCELLIAHFTKPSSNMKYQNKHLELKEFVQQGLADSLNGYDSFLTPDYPQDRYSIKLKQLQSLRDRLELDRLLIGEDRYKLGGHGKYHCLNCAEIKLIKSCTLFEFHSILKEAINMEQKEDEGFDAAKLPQACSVIDACVETIDYELNMIDHIRRIQWQNARIHEFASEDSELVKMRRAADKAKRRQRFWLPLLGIILLTAAVFFLLIKFGGLLENNFIGTMATTVYAPILVLLLQWWWQYWNK